MAHRLAPEAATELDGIWYFVARESCSVDIADRVIDSITSGFFFLPPIPILDAAAMKTCAPSCAVFPLGSMSSSTASKAKMF